MTEDLYNYKQRLETTSTKIQNSTDIREENKKLARQFKDWLALRSTSYSRQYRYLSSMKKVIEYNDFSLGNLKEDEESKRKITKVIRQIKESVYYHKEYSIKTKKEYNGFIKRLLEFHGLSSDPSRTELLPDGFTAYVSEKDKKRTPPEDLPTPNDVKKLARWLQGDSEGLNQVKLPATLITLWDTGARIGECLSIKVGGVEVNGESVTLKVPGNKESPDRKVPCVVAAPILKHWLENCHPDPNNPEAFLFCNNDKPEQHASYRYFTEKLKKAAEEKDVVCKLEGDVNHIFRKGRISYLKKSDMMSETMIDIRVGHIPESDETRTYTRISDEEAGNNYFSGYGLENEAADKIEEDVLPVECKNCGDVNSGHRKSCKECTDILDEKNYLNGVEVKSAVTEDVEEMTHKLNKRIVKNETPLKDEKIDEQAKLIVAEEKGIDPGELEWS